MKKIARFQSPDRETDKINEIIDAVNEMRELFSVDDTEAETCCFTGCILPPDPHAQKVPERTRLLGVQVYGDDLFDRYGMHGREVEIRLLVPLDEDIEPSGIEVRFK